MAKFNPIVTPKKEGNVNVSWLPQEFAQSRLGNIKGGKSDACTIITVLVAQKCYQNSIKIDASKEQVNQDLINALGESILQGNQIHKQLSQSGALVHIHLTVPEAIDAAGPRMKFISEWKSFITPYELRETLYIQLSESVVEWYRNPPPLSGSDLFVILIAQTRSVLLVFQSETNSVALIDSHSHGSYGSVIACCALSQLKDLCSWISDMMSRYGPPRPYELTFLYFRKLDSGEQRANS